MNSKPLCLITGASRGLGEYLAKTFWMNGYSLCMVSSNHDNLRSCLKRLPHIQGQEAVVIRCDLSQMDQADNLVNTVKSRFDKIDVLINNAAILGPVGKLLDNDVNLWHKTIQVNLLSPIALCRSYIDLMKDRGGGVIINLSGGGAAKVRPNFSAYSTAKTGLVRFSEIIACEYRDLNIRVNCIAPGVMNTEMLHEIADAGVNQAGYDEYTSCMNEIQKSDDTMSRVGDLALFLASSKGSVISGKLISAVWDNWTSWADHHVEMVESDVYTLRRITGRDRGFEWGDL